LVRRFTGFAAPRSSGYLAFREKSFTSGIYRPLALPQRPLAATFGQSSHQFTFFSFSPYPAFIFHIIKLAFSLFCTQDLRRRNHHLNAPVIQHPNNHSQQGNKGYD
jgi:hypothetical protein